MGRWVILAALIAGVGAVIFLALPRERPKILWQIDVVASWTSAPAVGNDGTIYFGDHESNLCAVARDGSFAWKAHLPAHTNAPYRYLRSPAIGPSKDIYATSSAGELFAFTREGRLLWLADLGIPSSTAPAIGADKTVYVGSTNGNLHAFNPDGSSRWTFKTAGDKTGNPAIATNGMIYFGCSSSNLYALNPDGTLKWICGAGARFFSHPIIGSDGTIYVECWPKFHAIRPDGTIQWSLTHHVAGQSAVLSSSCILFLCDSNGVLAVEAATGKVTWKHTAPDYGLLPTQDLALGRDGTIYFSGDRTINAIDRKGRLKWTFRRDPNPDPWREGLVQRIWRRLFRIKLQKQFYPCGFTLTDDGRLYAIMPDRKLYALEVSAGLDTNAPWPMLKHDVQHSGRASLSLSTSK